MFPHGVVGHQLRAPSRNSLSITVVLLLAAIITLSQVAAISAYPHVSLKSLDLPEPEAWKSSEELDDEDDYISFMRKLVFGIITFVIAVVVICLVLCFCCPICIIAKMRQRRGVIIRTGPGATATTNGNTVTVTVNRSAPPPQQPVTSPQVVAISNNLNSRNKPYPVQESVTVVPLLQPQMQMPAQYHPTPQQMNISYPPPGPQFAQNFELPPPYPGLPRDTDATNLPYNPYFSGDNESPSAPPPK